MDNQAFYYVDGIPTKGKWIDLEFIDNTDEILEELAEAGYVGRNEVGEPEYGGDLLVADVEGELAGAFSGSYDLFDLDGFVECRDECNESEYEAAAKYIEHFGEWSKSNFRDSYQGEYSSEEDFAQELASELGNIPDYLLAYIDWEKYARDMFINDFVYVDGFVFSSH